MSTASTSLKEYLRKYTSTDDEDKKNKKKKKKKTKPDYSGVLVVDQDPVWQKPTNVDEDEEDLADEEKPQVDEDVEVKRMKKLEQLRARRPYGAISEDGSGWVSVSDMPNSTNTEDHNSDISPPRARRRRNDTPSPRPGEEPNSRVDSDLSPPRQRRKHYDGPPQSEISLSPPRRQVREKHSPEAERKSSYSRSKASDISPPRRARRDSSYQDDHRASSPADLSPPRVRNRRNDTPSPSPEGQRKVPVHSRSDLSPPRKQRKHYDAPPQSEIDLSPPRRQPRDKHTLSSEAERKSSYSRSTTLDSSPPRRARRDVVYQDGQRASSPADLSPPRKVKNNRSASMLSSKKSYHIFDDGADRLPSNSDLSPPRRRKGSPIQVHRSKTGLVSGEDIKEDISRKRNEDLLRFKEMDSSMSGRGADATYRDKKTGKRMSKEEFLESQTKKKEKPKEIKLEWGKGLAQKREAEARLQEIEEEKAKPFARGRDDADLDSMLKERVRWGDPMAHLVKNKHLDPVLPNLGDSEKMKESGFIIPQEIPSYSWIKRRLEAAPNRYGIKPGRHWDGVDRSNGYEKQLFNRTNEKRATEREAYLWSVADM